MPVLSRRYTHAVCAMMLACSVGALVLAHSRARAASVGQLQQQISAGQGQIQNLAGAVSAASSRLAQLDSSISTLEHRLDRLQVELNARLRELAATKAELRV